MDYIYIEGLRLKTLIGIYPRERILPQTVEINLSFSLPEQKTAYEKISQTIDYSKVVSEIENLLAAQGYDLLEQMAEAIANLLINKFSCKWVKLSVAKPCILKQVKNVAINIERYAP